MNADAFFHVRSCVTVSYYLNFESAFLVSTSYRSGRVKTAQRQKCTRGLNCTDPKLHECTKLHEGTKLHKDYFATRVKLARLSVLHGDNFAQNNTNLKQLNENCKECMFIYYKKVYKI